MVEVLLEPVVVDERVARLPAWAREHVAYLAGRARAAERQVAELQAVLADPMPGDTLLVTPNSAGDVPDRSLGDGAYVEFAGAWVLTTSMPASAPLWAKQAAQRGVKLLHVEAYQPLHVAHLDGDQAIIWTGPKDTL